LNIRAAGFVVNEYVLPGTTFMDAWSVAVRGARGVAQYFGLDDFQYKACSTLYDDALNAVTISVGAIVPRTEERFSHFHRKPWKLSKLYVLAFISQHKCEKYFLDVYASIKKTLDNVDNFDRSKEDIQKIFHIYMQNKQEPNNPYLQSLDRMINILADVSKE
jgi:hypothetical protein